MKKLAFVSAFALAATVVLFVSAESFAADSSYEVAKTDASLAPGGNGKASVTITAKNGWHLNAEAPITLKLAPEAGVTVDKEKLVRADLAMSTPAAARFDVGLSASEAGKKAVQAEVGFVLCQEDSCKPVKEKLTLAVDVAAPAAVEAKRPAKAKKK